MCCGYRSSGWQYKLRNSTGINPSIYSMIQFRQGVTNRCHLSWLTNSALNAGGRGLPVSAYEHSCAHWAQINFGDLTPYLTYGCRIWEVVDEGHTDCEICGRKLFSERFWVLPSSNWPLTESTCLECTVHTYLHGNSIFKQPSGKCWPLLFYQRLEKNLWKNFVLILTKNLIFYLFYNKYFSMAW